MYFKLFKPQNWRKRSAEARRHNRAVLPPQMGSRLFHSKEAARKGLLPLLHPEIRKESPLAVSASRCRSLGFRNPTI